MEKKKIFSKINIRDYNNELEKIMDKKYFPIDIKNILLNMLYKIETSYDDYNLVKVDTISKKEFIQDIFEIIENKCKEIKLTNGPNDKRKVKKNDVIYAYNEQSLIYELFKIQSDFKINSNYRFINEPMNNLLKDGYSMDMSEIIRDFDGWSWNINKNSISNITYNLVYQDIKYLINNIFLIEWRNAEENDINYLQELKRRLENRYNKNLSENIINLIMKISVLEHLKEYPESKQELIKLEEETKETLENMNNKTKYIQEIVEKKKQIGKKVNRLDKIINNRTILEREFIDRNNRLNEDEVIFSLSDLSVILSNERQELINELKYCNKLINPKNYINERIEVKKRMEFLTSLELQDINLEEKIFENIILLQKNFLKAIEIRIDKLETKKDIYDMVCLLRYYKKIPITNELSINDIEELKRNITKIEKKLITKGCNLKAINIISYNIQINYKIISKILDTKIINLNDIIIELVKKDTKNILNIYEENIIDTSIPISDKYIEDINLKYNKKTKIFI